MVGPSGTGKTTIQKELETRYGLKAVESYTSRKPRYEGEEGHIFVSREEILGFPDKVAFTDYNGNLYCATQSQVDECDIYVIDVDGVKEFRRLYHGKKTPIVFGLTLSETTCYNRMIERGDTWEAAAERIMNDRKAFAELRDIADVTMTTAAVSPETVADNIMNYIKSAAA